MTFVIQSVFLVFFGINQIFLVSKTNGAIVGIDQAAVRKAMACNQMLHDVVIGMGINAQGNGSGLAELDNRIKDTRHFTGRGNFMDGSIFQITFPLTRANGFILKILIT